MISSYIRRTLARPARETAAALSAMRKRRLISREGQVSGNPVRISTHASGGIRWVHWTQRKNSTESRAPSILGTVTILTFGSPPPLGNATTAARATLDTPDPHRGEENIQLSACELYGNAQAVLGSLTQSHTRHRHCHARQAPIEICGAIVQRQIGPGCAGRRLPPASDRLDIAATALTDLTKN